MVQRTRETPVAIKAGSRPARSNRLGVFLVVAAVFTVAGVAQGAWQVYDRQVHEAVKDVKEEVSELRQDVRPAWNSGGNAGAYNPYAGRQKDYALVTTVTRDEKYGVKAKCGVDDGSYTGDALWQVPLIPETGELSSAQLTQLNKDVCQRLVAAENRRFQHMVETMARIKQRNDALRQMAERRASITEAGELSASDNNLQMSIADAQVEIQYMQATLAAYDSLIVTLNQTQSSIADVAINGDNTVEQSMRRAAITAAITAAAMAD